FGVGAVPEIGAAGAFVGGADAVAPVVGIGEAAARIADDGCFDFFHVVDEVAAQTVVVGNFGFRADPDAVIDDAAEVFGEMAVDVGRDGAKRFVGENFDARVGGGCGSGEAGVMGEGEGGGAGESGVKELAAWGHTSL